MQSRMSADSSDGTTHDVEVAPYLIDGLDLEQTEILCADKG